MWRDRDAKHDIFDYELWSRKPAFLSYILLGVVATGIILGVAELLVLAPPVGILFTVLTAAYGWVLNKYGIVAVPRKLFGLKPDQINDAVPAAGIPSVERLAKHRQPVYDTVPLSSRDIKIFNLTAKDVDG